MFYFIVSKLPIISGITDGSKFYKILVVGSICYVILHAILYSNIGENIELIRTYRKYMYYLWALDGVLTAGYMKFLCPVAQKQKLEDNSDDDNNEDDDDELDPENHPTGGLTREQILAKIQSQDKRDTTTPFIKKTDVSQNNNTNTKPNQTTSVTSGQTLNQTSPKNVPPLNNKNNGSDNNDLADMSDTDIPSYKAPAEKNTK